jgi:NAD-dependent SIR2 family protein deacetylase
MEKVMHGKLGHSDWELPRLIVHSSKKARPDRNSSMDASEYLDQPDVLNEKIALLASLIEQSENFIALTGAGISTSLGITDYASKGKETGTEDLPLAGDHRRGKDLSSQVQPTLAHRVLSSMEKKNLLKHWIYLNHDGLAEKAGYPKNKLNEFHGSWFDPDNPVALTDDDLRPDLIRWLEEWKGKTDLCLVMGTSLAGMKADSVAKSAALKNGLVIINYQRTVYDQMAALRIFASCDQAMNLLAEKLRLNV